MVALISVHADMKALRRQLDDFAKKQLPFATAQAINAVAMKVQAAERANLQSRLDRPTPFTVNSVAVKKATKSTLTATVYVKDIAARYLAPYETGGTQALPGSSRAALNPKDPTLLNRYGGLPRNKIATLRNRPDVFVGTVQTKDGPVDGVWQRPYYRPKAQKRGRSKLPKGSNTTGRLKLLVRFTDPQPVTKELHYGTTAAEIVKRNMPIELRRAFAQAMKTAK
jgi:hypothetical protein